MHSLSSCHHLYEDGGIIFFSLSAQRRQYESQAVAFPLLYNTLLISKSPVHNNSYYSPKLVVPYYTPKGMYFLDLNHFLFAKLIHLP